MADEMQVAIQALRAKLEQKCKSNEVSISWNTTGPQGPKGDKGDKGDPGSPIIWSGGCSQDGPSETVGFQNLGTLS